MNRASDAGGRKPRLILRHESKITPNQLASGPKTRNNTFQRPYPNLKMCDLDQAFRVDIAKAIEVIVYIASRAPRPDLYHVGKILYFTDKFHLERYGGLICHDKYVAMKDGPVPSAVYDLLKDVRDAREKTSYYDECVASFSVAGREGRHMVTALRESYFKKLSESEMECMDSSIYQYGDMDFGQLKEISHDAAYDKADANDDIPLEAIIDTLVAAEDIKNHIKEGLLV